MQSLRLATVALIYIFIISIFCPQTEASNLGEESKEENRLPQVENIQYTPEGLPQLIEWGKLEKKIINGECVTSQGNHLITLTLDCELQQKAEKMLHQFNLPWGALVAMDPKSGKILTLAGYSSEEPGSKSIAIRAGFPAASLFKLITASAAIEQAGLSKEDQIRFRGGNYTLSQGNYRASNRTDNRQMTLEDALGKSINPVFGRIALQELERGTLETYARNFGFEVPLLFEIPVEQSHFELEDDDYSIARTGAGFGKVTISPLHAALITAAIANRGKMMRPYLVEQIKDEEGKLEYQGSPRLFKEAILASTAEELLQAMILTVTEGTAKKQFKTLNKTSYGDIAVAAKTGTLNGDNPKGLYTWFVAAAPVDNPKIVISALVINPGNARIKGSELGRRFLEIFFKSELWE